MSSRIPVGHSLTGQSQCPQPNQTQPNPNPPALLHSPKVQGCQAGESPEGRGECRGTFSTHGVGAEAARDGDGSVNGQAGRWADACQHRRARDARLSSLSSLPMIPLVASPCPKRLPPPPLFLPSTFSLTRLLKGPAVRPLPSVLRARPAPPTSS